MTTITDLYKDYRTHCDFRLDPEKKVIWITALRSGNYKQGTGMLYYQVSKTYCCLGVYRSHFKSVGAIGGYLDSKEIPQEVQTLLATMNDGTIGSIRKHSFAEIADWIEANL